jgi:hypothetical protein
MSKKREINRNKRTKEGKGKERFKHTKAQGSKELALGVLVAQHGTRPSLWWH